MSCYDCLIIGAGIVGLATAFEIKSRNPQLKIAGQLMTMYYNNQNNFRELSHNEFSKYVKTNFLKSAQRLLPYLSSDDLVPTNKVGIKPQLINVKERKLEMDFILEHTAHSTHVLNAISPAFTSAFAFASIIVDASGVV